MLIFVKEMHLRTLISKLQENVKGESKGENRKAELAMEYKLQQASYKDYRKFYQSHYK